MDGSRFKVKIIGGKLVHVPDFNYVKEFKQSSKQGNRDKYQHIPQSQSRQGNLAKYPTSYVNSTGYQKHERRSDIRVNRTLPDREKLRQEEHGNEMNKCSSFSPDYNQRRSNQHQAERNKERAQQQLHSSSLVLDPIVKDVEEHAEEEEQEDEALSKQVADCLQHTNKQKIAFALRAMKRLDVNGGGYITVREFRDVLLMYQIFIIGGTLEKLIDKYRNNGGKINYVRLWNFVSDSFDSRNSLKSIRKSPEDQETEKDNRLKAAVRNVQRFLRAYAQKHNEIYDFSEMTNSLENCDRSRSHLMRIKEMRIICSYYLEFEKDDLDTILVQCDQHNNGWVNYQSFLKILKDAQPTYLPPINLARRNTYNLEDEGMISVQDKMKKKEDKEENKEDIFYREGMWSKEDEGYYQSEKIGYTRNGRLEERKNLEEKDRGSEEYFQRETPRRKWYESEESWKKRKRRDVKVNGKSKPIERKKWEHFAPVRRIKDSHEDELNEEMQESIDLAEDSYEDTFHKTKHS